MDEGKTRLFGLDLLRLLSMLMVIVLHILGQGGILEAAEPGSTVWYAAWGLECLCYCAVDCYGLLSGYLGGGRRPWGKLVRLWLTVVLYSFLYYCFFRLRSPELVDSQALRRVFLPVTTRQYWYFTAYFGLALLMPVLDGGLERLESRRAGELALLILLLFCALPAVLQADPFQLRGGYCLLWLLLLYLLGGLLRRSGFFGRLRPLPLIAGACLSLALTYYTHLHPVTVPGFGAFTLLSYTSPTVLLFALCLLLLFRRLRLGGRAAGLVTALSRTSFGVYILHTNPLLWKLLYVPGCLGAWAALPAKRLLFQVPACALWVYLLCSLPEALRMALFRVPGLLRGIREKKESRN